MKTYKQLQERINMAKAKMGDVIKDFQDSDAPQFKGKSDEKRREMAIAAKMSAEEVETNEELKGNQHKIDANKNGKVDAHDFKLLRKKKVAEEAEELEELSTEKLLAYREKARKADTNKHHVYADEADKKIKKKTGVYNPNLLQRAKAKLRNEEAEELEELSKATLASYVGKAAKDFAKRKPKMGYDGQLKKMQNRSVGVGRALDKVYKEEVEEQIEESDGLKPFIVVHAKHGKFETHAGSTYEAAKNAAAHWKTKKGTSGMDVHRADITHSTQHVG